MSRKNLLSALLVSVLLLPFIYLLSTRSHALGITQQVLWIWLMVFAASLGAIQLSAYKSSGASNKSRKTSRKPRQEIRRQPVATVVSGARESGQVKWFNASKGFGFITRDNGDDVFVHFRSIRGEGHRILKDGEHVEFSITMGDKGPQAEDVASASR
ncbi:MAG TPA: cold shock domain-containing protein [Pseudohongiella sp.]|nr:cold shock domain-containing protein [Pseudohongiella sp.]